MATGLRNEAEIVSALRAMGCDVVCDGIRDRDEGVDASIRSFHGIALPHPFDIQMTSRFDAYFKMKKFLETAAPGTRLYVEYERRCAPERVADAIIGMYLAAVAAGPRSVGTFGARVLARVWSKFDLRRRVDYRSRYDDLEYNAVFMKDGVIIGLDEHGLLVRGDDGRTYWVYDKDVSDTGIFKPLMGVRDRNDSADGTLLGLRVRFVPSGRTFRRRQKAVCLIREEVAFRRFEKMD